MCGRLTRLHTQAEIDEILEIERQYRIEEHDAADEARNAAIRAHNAAVDEYQAVAALGPSWNVAPTQAMPVVGQRDGARVVRSMRWGLVPAWTKTVVDAKESAAHCINARSESVGTKPSFRAAFAKRRCLVPVSGWFEWKVSGDARERRKIPHYLTARDSGLLVFAGIWEAWKNPETGEDVRTFSILTGEPNALVAQVHDRAPVILSPEGAARWLDPTTPLPALHALLVPSPAEALAAWEVGRAVGNVRANDATLIDPVRAEERAA